MFKLIIGNFFKTLFDRRYDIIFTDPPYKAFKKSGSANFDVAEMMKKFVEVTKKDAAIIIFCNSRLKIDIFRSMPDGLEFWTEVVWDKAASSRSWLSWRKPLRHTEYILFFRKGNFEFNFWDGSIKPPHKRAGSFGGVLKKAKSKKLKYSFGVFAEVWTPRVYRSHEKIHPTQKPVEFSVNVEKITQANFRQLHVLDPFCGSGNLLKSFESATGVDNFSLQL